MKKHKSKIIATVIILCALAGAWVFGGSYAVPDAPASSEIASDLTASAVSAAGATTAADASSNGGKTSASAVSGGVDGAVSASADAAVNTSGLNGAAGASDSVSGNTGATADMASASADMAPASADAASASVGVTPASADAAVNTYAANGANAVASAANGANGSGTEMVVLPETGKDKYLTSPPPKGKPLPVEPQNTKLGETAYTATLSVRCDTILDNMRYLDSEKHELVPSDGIIYSETAVTFYEGESVFNLLQREMKRAKIHMEFVNTPIYNSAYIEGINNLYEFDAGELSGWTYKVNGWFPNYGCSRYSLKDGDVVEWIYTCDLGRDIGGYNALGGK
ncbi:MAG: DUF4430 domain-containing protein [Clostridiales Family XIII bacterium]|jgi:hypothetical protein|nr:DUF4430 domain-containing protein [Clostridiales Family XIII bacterium]